jgi:hypothetical protein
MRFLTSCGIIVAVLAVILGLLILNLPSLVELRARSQTSGFGVVLAFDRATVAKLLPESLELAPASADSDGKHLISLFFQLMIKERPDFGPNFPPLFAFTYYEMIVAVPDVRVKDTESRANSPFKDKDLFFNLAMYVNISGPAMTGTLLGFPKIVSEQISWDSVVNSETLNRQDKYRIVYPKDTTRVPIEGDFTFETDKTAKDNIKCVDASKYREVLRHTINQTWITQTPLEGLVLFTQFDWDLWNKNAFQMCPVSAEVKIDFEEDEKFTKVLKSLNGHYSVPALNETHPLGAFYFSGDWLSIGPFQWLQR